MAFLPGYETMTLGFLPYHRRRGEYGAVGLSFSVAPELYNAMVAASGTDEASAYEKQIALTYCNQDWVLPDLEQVEKQLSVCENIWVDFERSLPAQPSDL